MDKNFTHGPWIIDESGRMVKALQGKTMFVDGMQYSAGFTVAQVFDGTKPGDVASNARLIAAAPDLLEAVEELLDLYMSMNNPTGPITIKAMQAIEKALGN